MPMTMSQQRRATITSVGRYVPEKVLSNTDLERMIETSSQWIIDRTGIHERHIAEDGTATSDLATHAAADALARRGLSPEEVDLIIVGTVTPDMMFPATACLVQDKLGASNAWGFDLSAACCGFVYALTVGAQFIESGAHERVLIIGADVMSSIINYEDRSTCVIFGDGAGAVLLEGTNAGSDGVGLMGYLHRIEGRGGKFLYMPGGGSRNPASADTVQKKMHYVHQDGRQVFKYAVRTSFELASKLLDRHGLTPDDIALLVAHQANLRILDATAERLGLPADKVFKNIQKFGNTTAATIPLALRDALDDGRINNGDLVLFSSVGAGFTAGVCLMRWDDLQG